MENYTALKNKYPDFLCLDELSRVCKIAKRSACYLVEHGIIPAIDTGKKTWRYKIAIDDVIAYLEHRDKYGSIGWLPIRSNISTSLKSNLGLYSFLLKASMYCRSFSSNTRSSVK